MVEQAILQLRVIVARQTGSGDVVASKRLKVNAAPRAPEACLGRNVAEVYAARENLPGLDEQLVDQEVLKRSLFDGGIGASQQP